MMNIEYMLIHIFKFQLIIFPLLKYGKMIIYRLIYRKKNYNYLVFVT